MKKLMGGMAPDDRKLSPHLPITQSMKEYDSLSPVFSMDDVDDVMMLFEGTEKDHGTNLDSIRIAWVISRLKNKRYF
jgi:hypothetical protein